MDLVALVHAYRGLTLPEQERFAAMVRAHQIFSSPMLVRELARRHGEIDAGEGPEIEIVNTVLSEWKVSEEVTRSFDRVVKLCAPALNELRDLARKAPYEAERLVSAIATYAEHAAANGSTVPDADLTVTDESGRTDRLVLIRRAICVCWVDDVLRKVRMLAFRGALD